MMAQYLDEAPYCAESNKNSHEVLKLANIVPSGANLWVALFAWIYPTIETRAQFFASFEERRMLGVHVHALARARIAADPCPTRADRKGPKATQLYAVTFLKRIANLFEDRVNDTFDIAMKQMRVLRGEFSDEF
jgi:hypothetical protein